MTKQKTKKNEPELLHLDSELSPTKKDFRDTFQWKVFRIMAEFVDGFHFIANFKKTVAVFGSARLSPQNKYYQEASKLGQLLAKAGYTMITGGGPGIMEAANKGAFKAGGKSVGLNIQLPSGQRMNPYVKSPMGFNYFFIRKVILSFASQAYIFFPGGFGTLDEFFEMVVLVQTKKITKPIPIIVVGKEYWQPLLNWLKLEVHEKHKTIGKKDLEIFQLVDSAKEAFEIIKSRTKK